MNDIINKISGQMSEKLAKEIDDYALSVFNIPKWFLKRKLLLKYYAWFFKLNIEVQRSISDLSTDYRFFRLGKKIGEIKIRDIDLVFNHK
jgi:hypothetical protein